MNKRLKAILQWLIKGAQFDEERTISDVQERFSISERTVRYNLDEISDYLLNNGHHALQFAAGGRIILQDNPDEVAVLLEENDFSIYKLSRSERIDLICWLIMAGTGSVKLQTIAEVLSVSRSSVVRDLELVRKRAETFNVPILSGRTGLRADGRESSRRILMMSLLNDDIVAQYGRASDIYLSRQDMQILEHIIEDAEQMNRRWLTDEAFSELRQYLALLIRRHCGHHNAEIDYICEHPLMQHMASGILDKLSDYSGLRFSFQEEYCLSDILGNMHFIKRSDLDEQMMQIQIVTKRFIDAAAGQIGMDLRKDFQFYQNLADHLKSAFGDVSLQRNGMDEMLEEVTVNNPEITAAVRSCIPILEDYVGREMSETEIAYVVVHVCAAVMRGKSRNQGYRVVLVCNSGIGTSQLLQARLMKYFPVDVVDVLPAHALPMRSLENVDMVISTVPVDEDRCPTVMLHPFLNDEDCIVLGNKLGELNSRPRETERQTQIEETVRKAVMSSPLDKEAICRNVLAALRADTLNNGNTDSPSLSSLLFDSIQVDVSAEDWREAIRCSAIPLVQNYAVTPRYVEHMIENVEQNGPYVVLAPGFALPHEAPYMGSSRLAMNLIRLKKPVSFNGCKTGPVEFVCCLATKDRESHLYAMFHLMNMLAKPEFSREIREAADADELYEVICRYEALEDG